LGFDHSLEHIDEEMFVVQSNLDDMNPEWCSHISDSLFAAGANDVYWIPIIMKKGRPGLMLNVLVQADRLEQVEDVIFRETTTLGLRYIRTTCHRLGRRFEIVETPWGQVSVKEGYHREELVQFAPEFADCERIAKEHGVPLKAVYDEVRRLYVKKRKEL